VLDVGAGTGRVSLDLAARGVAVVAMDVDAALLDALRHRAVGLGVETVVADAREFALARRFALVLVPMQTLQLFGGPAGRNAFLRRARDHLLPGGMLAVALADAMDCFDDERDLPPPPDACEFGGVRYASQLLAVVDDGGRAAIHRRRAVIDAAGTESTETVVRLDRVTADQVAAEAVALGFRTEPHLAIAETDEYLGSTVVVLRAPSGRPDRGDAVRTPPRRVGRAPLSATGPRWDGHGSAPTRETDDEESTMEAHDEELGPVDIVVIAFPADAPMTGDAVPMLLDLVDRKIVRVLDVLFVVKNEDGTFSGFDAVDLDSKGVGDLAVFEGATSGLLGDEDAATAADALEPGSAAILLVYENRWAAPFAAAVRRNGGRLVDFQRIPMQELIASLEAAEAAA
jgi:SAM-dependent methyltransferase